MLATRVHIPLTTVGHGMMIRGAEEGHRTPAIQVQQEQQQVMGVTLIKTMFPTMAPEAGQRRSRPIALLQTSIKGSRCDPTLLSQRGGHRIPGTDTTSHQVTTTAPHELRTGMADITLPNHQGNLGRTTLNGMSPHLARPLIKKRIGLGIKKHSKRHLRKRLDQNLAVSLLVRITTGTRKKNQLHGAGDRPMLSLRTVMMVPKQMMRRCQMTGRLRKRWQGSNLAQQGMRS